MSDEAKQIAAGERVSAFLADEAVKGAFVDLEKRYFGEFKKASTVEEREALHARVRALDDLFTSVLGIVDSGKVAQHTRDQREKTEARQSRNPRAR